MKKTLVFVTMMVATISFGQTTQATNSNQNPSTSTNLPNLSIHSAGMIQSIGTAISSSNNQPINAGDHVCKTFELNQQHYQNRGVLNEFNQNSLSGAQNATSLPINKTPGVNTISVIFHVVYNPNNPSENVSNALIMQVYNDLSEDYQLLNSDATNARTGFGFNPADANINFCLATQDPFGNPLAETGVIRVSTTEDWYDSDNGEENKMKASSTGGSEIWDRNKYLNVWVCDITNGASSGTAGYAYRPSPSFLPSSSIDGIVLDYNIGMNNSNILTHETGHYLGLDHTWGGSGSCGSDDGFTDTPNTQGPSFNFPGTCSGSQQTCSGTETQYENYMDYANCTVMFTQNQADYMVSILQGIRGSLLLSTGCDPTNTPPVSLFTSTPTGPAVIPVNGGVNFIDLSTNVPTGWTWTISGIQSTDWDFINTTTTNSQNPQVEFYTVGTYDVTLVASNTYGTDATPEISIGHVQVVAPTSGTACDTLRNWDPADADLNGYYYYNPTASGWGNYPGHCDNDGSGLTSTQYAEKFTFTGTAEVRQIAMPFFTVADNSGSGTIELRVYADNAGTPGAVLTSEIIDIADITNLQWNEFDFTTPASVTGTFWVGYELYYGSPQDTILVGMTNTISGGNDSYYSEITGLGWFDMSTIGITGSIALDVMLSNGPSPLASFTATGSTVCLGGSIDVNGSGSSNVTDYEWFVTDDPLTTIITTSTTPTNTFSFPTVGNFSIYLLGNGSCETDAVLLAVTVNPLVSATVTPNSTTCGNNNGSIVISAETGGDGTYFYSLDGINYVTTNTFNNLASGNYTVYVATLGDLCEATYNVTVGSSAAFVAGISSNSSICLGASTSITASGGSTYSWLDGSTTIGSSPTVSVTPPITTQYSCIVTDASGCQSTVFTTITVNTLPSAPTISASGPTTICAGSSVDLTSSYSTNNTWSTTETSSIINVSAAGPYTVTYTDVNGCSSTSLSTTITVNPTPVISAGTVTNPSVCASTTGSIQVSGTGTGNISWTGTATGTVSSITLPYTISTLASGSYNITFTDGIGCSSNLLTQALNDPTPPTTPVISVSGATTFCSGNSVTLTSSYAGGNTWSTSETTDVISVNSSNTISLTYTDGAGCSATSSPIIITVNPTPSTPIVTASGVTTFCTGGSVDLTSSQGSGNVWSSGPTTQAINVATPGNYSVTYTDGNGCSATSANTLVTVNTIPTVNAGANQMVCDGNSITLAGTGTATSYLWDNGAMDNTPFAPTSSFTYTVTGTDANGCTNIDQVDVTVNILPTVNAGADQSICDGIMVVLVGSGASTYSWDNSIFDATPFTQATGTVTYTVTGTDANGCENTDAVDVTVNANPTVTSGALGQLCVYNSPITLTNGTPTGGVYSGTGVTAGDFDPTSAGIGTFTITYTYTDGNGCIGSTTQDIIVDGCSSVQENEFDQLLIYPNPMTTELIIEFTGDYTIVITDARGRMIDQLNGSDITNINTSNYEAGVYFITINNGNSTSVQKVIKK